MLPGAGPDQRGQGGDRDRQVAAGQGRLEEADRLARAALRAAENGPGSGVQPEVACEALEVIGRVARQRHLEQA